MSKSLLKQVSAQLADKSSSELVAWGKRAIEEAGSFEEIKSIRDKAGALRAYTRAIGAAAETVMAATEIKIRAERRMGQELNKLEKNPGAKGNPGGQGSKLVRSEERTAQSPTLSEIGVSKQRASEWQTLAKASPEQFEAAVENLKEAGELSSSAVSQVVKEAVGKGLTADEIAETVSKVSGKGQPSLASRLYELDRLSILKFEPAEVARSLHPAEHRGRAGVARNVAAWLGEFIDHLEQLQHVDDEAA